MNKPGTIQARGHAALNIFLTLLALFEATLMISYFLSSPLWPDSVSRNAGAGSLLLATPVVAAFAYIVWHALPAGALEAKQVFADRWLLRSLKILAGYLALFAGMAFTVLAFGERGPFGAMTEGIGGIELPLDEKYWPLVFLSGVAVFLWIAHSSLLAMKKEVEIGKKRL